MIFSGVMNYFFCFVWGFLILFLNVIGGILKELVLEVVNFIILKLMKLVVIGRKRLLFWNVVFLVDYIYDFLLLFSI